MTGSVQQKNGKYYAVLNLYDEKGKRQQKWIATGYPIKGNKKRAEKFLRDKIFEYEAKIIVAENEDKVNEIKFVDCITDWLNSCDVQEVTKQGYEVAVRNHILPYFRKIDMKLVDVNRKVIQNFIDEKQETGNLKTGKGLSPRTLKLFKVIIGLVIKEAMKNDYIDKNPCEFVTLPKQAKRKASTYNSKQISELFEKIKEEELYPLIRTTLLYGLRRSEVCALQWDSVNLADNLITIKYTLSGVTKFVHKATTKNESSYRSFPLLPEVKEIVEKAKKAEIENKKLLGKQYIDNNYIFKWADGRPFDPDYVTSKFARTLKEYGLPHIRFHDLRHSCASYLASKGYTQKDIQEWLGHSSITTTANIYSHLDTERKEKIAAEMAKA